MLFILEVAFFVVGIWILVSGKLPPSIFKLLFGKGEYVLTPGSARLLGAFLATPLPAAFGVGFALGMFSPKQIGYAAGFEVAYVLIVAIAALVIARRIRRPEPAPVNQTALAPSTPEAERVGPPFLSAATPASPTRSYGSRLLIVSGLAVLSCITAVSLGTLIMVLGSYAIVGGTRTGRFMDDVFPWIVLVAVTALGIFGIVMLVRKLRKPAPG